MRWTAVAILLVLSCSRAERDPFGAAIARQYPRVDGSTSTHPLAVLIACKLQGVGYEWKRPPALERTVFPTHTLHPLLAAKIEENVRHHGTHEAYLSLIQDRSDLILVAREPSGRELEAARVAGVALDVKPVALDALVFVLNARNSIENLNADQIRRIFGSPGTRSWIDLGGPAAAIEPFQREPDSGSQELMEKLVMKGLPMRDEREVPRIYTMAGVVNKVAAHEKGIAFSIYYYVTNMAPDEHIRMIAIDGVRPTAATIASRAYPLTSEVFAVVRKGLPPGSPAASLLGWLQTGEGQAAVRESGYVPRGRP